MRRIVLGRFARLGRKLDLLIDQGVKLFKGRFTSTVPVPPPPVEPEVNLNLPPIVWLEDPFNGRYQAYFLKKNFTTPSIHAKVNITDEESFAEALNKAGYAARNPQFRLIDQGELYDIDYEALKKDL